MCTVLLAYKKISGWPLVVANNRDEFFQRRALPPRVYVIERKSPGLRWIASCDLTGGGSWWGCNGHGLLVWLTNRWTEAEFATGRRSRGEIVTELLRCPDPAAARLKLEKLCDGVTFNPFNIIVAARTSAFFAGNFPNLHFSSLASGFHYLGNGQLTGCDSFKAKNARRLLAGFSGKESLEKTLSLFRQALRTPLPQDSIPPQGFNVRFDGYGTTSSLLLALPETDKTCLKLHYCDVNPLYKDYRDYSRLGLLL
jgi:uncharacterized protein with NRDE domain